MNSDPADDRSQPTLRTSESFSDLCQIAWLRYTLLSLLVLSSLAGMTFRLMHTQRMQGDSASPMLSANDRSRWVTIRSLVERGAYDIDIYTNDPLQSRQWNTIDKVVHQNQRGETHQYSSKPPILATLISLPTWTLMQATGWNFETNLFPLVRSVLWLCQILPLAITLGYLAWILERLSLRPETTLFVVACACWGTFVTTYAVSLNNHHFAVLSVYWTIFALLEIYCFGREHFGWFILAGLASAFTAATELPALSFFCCVAALLLWTHPMQTLRASLPAMLLIAVAAFGTNLIAHESLRPPYAHRNDGQIVLKLPIEIREDLKSETLLPQSLRDSINRHADQLGFQLTPASVVEKSRYPLKGNTKERWVIRDYFMGFWASTQWRGLALTLSPDESHWELRKWDNWYDYPGSYWHDGARKGVDVGQADPWRYAFNCLLGHHGIFSLTPIWILTVVGIGFSFRSRRTWAVLSATTILLSVVVIGFYLMRPQLDRNFGGQTSALRWVFWLSPLWLLAMIPGLEKILTKPVGRWVCFVLLVASAASALSSAYNPWVHPWIYQWLEN